MIEQEVRNKIKQFRPTSQALTLVSPNINDKSIRLYKFTDNKNNGLRLWVFTDRVQLEIPITTSLLFSINFPDKVCLANKFLQEINGVGKLYTDNSQNDQIKKCIRLIEADLKLLYLNENEGFTVYGNCIQLTLTRDRQILPELEICNRIKPIIELHYPNEINDIDYSDVPDDLRQLIVQYQSWSISDDFEREEKISGSTKKERTELINSVEPRLGEINKFLDSFKDEPYTEGAIKLQCLAEIFIELQTAR